jgi:tol-pal system-associated acyl-CoA thioesterase
LSGGNGMSAFVLPIRVYLEDTDAQGVVYNGSYFRFMERARTERLRAAGIDHDELRERDGVALVLAAIEVRFRAPARLSDMLYVSADVSEVRGARVIFEQKVRRAEPGGDVICSGIAEVACMDAAGGGPKRLPRALVSELKE